MKILHNITAFMKVVTVCLLFTSLAWSCTEDKTQEEGFMTFKDDDNSFLCPAEGGSKRITIYSNMRSWKLVPENAEDTWVTVWPKDGDDDGNVTFTVPSTDSGYSRTSKVNLVVGNRVITTFTVKQIGCPPFITFDLTSNKINVAMESSDLTINLTTNIKWKASIVADTDNPTNWITLGTTTETSQVLKFADNSNNIKSRTATVRFAMENGEEEFANEIIIKQLGATTYEKASKITIADLINGLKFDADGVAEIEDNYRIDGWIVSNKATKNIDDNLMYVQDASGRGMLFEFKDKAELQSPADANMFDMNRQVSIHACGLKLSRNSKGLLRVTDFMASSVKANSADQPSSPVAVKLSDLSTIEDYINTLVTIDPVEFAVPYGTYSNVSDIINTSSVTTAWNKLPDIAKELCDPYIEYGHIIRDKSGNSVKAYFAFDFTERYNSLIPKGSGPLTAIVSKYKDRTILKLRNATDAAMSDNASTRKSQTLVSFGPWLDSELKSASAINAKVGTGNIHFSVPLSNDALDDFKFYGNNTTRFYHVSGDYRSNNTVKASKTAGYCVVTAKLWWNGNGSTVSNSTNGGEAFIISTSSLESATGKLMMSFAIGSSVTGPAYLVAEWAESENSTTWSKIMDFNSQSTERTGHMLQYNFALPNQMSGKSNVVIRLRVTQTMRADFTADIADTGTCRIGSFEISEIK